LQAQFMDGTEKCKLPSTTRTGLNMIHHFKSILNRQVWKKSSLCFLDMTVKCHIQAQSPAYTPLRTPSVSLFQSHIMPQAVVKINVHFAIFPCKFIVKINFHFAIIPCNCITNLTWTINISHGPRKCLW
jgi:hypothetical protein